MNKSKQFFNLQVGLWLICLLASTLWVANVHAQKQGLPPNDEIIIVGQNDPSQDFYTLANAFDQAASGDTLHLEGRFDLSACPGTPLSSGLMITKNITISGMSNPNVDPQAATQIVGCGPAFIINIPDEDAGALTIENIWFLGQTAMSMQFQNSVNAVNILNNRFTDNIPLSAGENMIRFAVGAAEVSSFDVKNLITIENNHVDFSQYSDNASFEGDDNGFAFAAAEVSLIIRNNFISTLGEAIEIEGNFGQENTYLVEDNIIQTMVPPSPAGESSGPPGSVAEGKEGGHPALIKLHANEGTFIVRNNSASMTGLPYGVCIMATTLNEQALAGEQVHFIIQNDCQMAGQLTALLGAWGQTSPFFTGAALSGALVAHNVVSGSGAVGIGMISRTAATGVGSMLNNGHDNHFLFNDFSDFTATNADIGFDPQSYDNLITARPSDNIIDLGSNNRILNQISLLPLIVSE